MSNLTDIVEAALRVETDLMTAEEVKHYARGVDEFLCTVYFKKRKTEL